MILRRGPGVVILGSTSFPLAYRPHHLGIYHTIALYVSVRAIASTERLPSMYYFHRK